MRTIRIASWPLKLVVVVGLWLAGSLALFGIVLTGVPEVVVAVMTYVIRVGSVLLAARVFRGKDEPVEPARQWWRITAWASLSGALGALFVLASVVSVIVTASALDNSQRGHQPLAGAYDPAASALIYVTLAFLYLNSAIRLKRAGIQRPEPEPEPKLAKPPKLD